MVEIKLLLIVFIYKKKFIMKNLEMNQMVNLQGGNTDYGDMSCEEFWAGVSIAAGALSWYAAAIFGPIGALVTYGVSVAASVGGMNCE